MNIGILGLGVMGRSLALNFEMRLMSSLKAERVKASQILGGNVPKITGVKERLIHLVEKALSAVGLV